MKIKKVFIITLAVFTSVLLTTCKKVEVPTQPTDVKAWQEGASIVISWKSVKHATTYRIYRSDTEKDYIPIGTVSETHFTDNTPLKGTNYYKVTAFNEDVESLEGGYATCNFTFSLSTLTTLQPTNVTFTSATLGGNISDVGTPPYTERGVCWSTSINPTIANSNNKQPIHGSGMGEFKTNITSLAENTIYYVRAYAINAEGITYGDQVCFATKEVKGVLINGVYWATSNVDMPGTFAANPEDAGMFYQWNRKVGWSSTNPIVNSNGGSIWDSTIPLGTAWINLNDPCPQGWRLPTREELSSLLSAGSNWTTVNGINGHIFGSGNNTIFLSAAGYRLDHSGQLSNVSRYGFYWSSAQEDNTLLFNEISAWRQTSTIRRGCSVRCVAE